MARGAWSGVATWAVVLVVTLGVVGGTGWFVHHLTSGGPDASPEPGRPVQGDAVYYVFLSQLEVADKKPSGGNWDRGGGAPDLRYEIWWRGARIFKSSTQRDMLLARWSAEELGIRDVLAGVSEERTIKAARVTAQSGEKLLFKAVDDDTLSRNDTIAEWEVPIDSLTAGEQVWLEPSPGVRRATCRVIPAEGRR